MRPAAVNTASPAGNMVTANGSNHPNVFASIRKAEPIQESPVRKYPNPNHQPIANAVPMPPHPTAATPSRSQTSGGKVTNIIGQRLIGANARVDAAPAKNAISALRQPQARMTGLARLNQFTASISLAFAVSCARQRLEWKLIHPCQLAVQPTVQRRAMLPLVGGRGYVRWPA